MQPTFSLGWIEISVFNYNNILENQLNAVFWEMEILFNDYFFVNSYIFTSYIWNQNIIQFSQKYHSNLIYSREENLFNLQIFAIKKSNSCIFNQTQSGVYIQNEYGKMLFINALLSLQKADFKTQTKDIYTQLFQKVDEYGFVNANIIKARNYIQDVLVYYKEFNEVRDDFFQNRLLFWDYPAGTGIDCLLPWNTLHLSDYFLFHSEHPDIKVSTISSDVQCEAKKYWPKFSRAKLISSNYDKNDVLFVSGTAAVWKTGESLFTHDIEKNIEYTFLSLQNVLSKASMNTSHIVSAFIYIKDQSFYKNFIEFYQKNNYTFHYIYTFCDICRDDFLFEIECIAVYHKE